MQLAARPLLESSHLCWGSRWNVWAWEIPKKTPGTARMWNLASLAITLRHVASGKSCHFVMHGFRGVHNAVYAVMKDVCDASIKQYAIFPKYTKRRNNIALLFCSIGSFFIQWMPWPENTSPSGVPSQEAPICTFLTFKDQWVAGLLFLYFFAFDPWAASFYVKSNTNKK